MKVLFDTDVLGLGHLYTRARTGVFRVAENLAHGLKRSKECSLSFCTSRPSSSVPQVLSYLEANSDFSDTPFPIPTYWQLHCDLHQQVSHLNEQIKDKSGAEQVRLRVTRKLVYSLYTGVKRIYQPIAPQSLSEADIYHSPFSPIPAQVHRSRRVKKFLTVHDLIPILYPQFFQFNEKSSLEAALRSLNKDSWIQCVSQSTKDDLCSHVKHIDPDKVFVTHLAASNFFYRCVDVQKLESVQKKYGIPASPYILSLSTLEPRKNIDHTIRCFINLVQEEKIEDLYLVLVGTKGWSYDRIFAELDASDRLRDRIILTGYVDDQDLATIYSNALAFVYLSLYEGFGLPPLEAMQCGVPVIASNTSSLPEVVGNAGILRDPKDTDGLCQSLLELYTEPDLRQNLSSKSLEQSKQFSWDRCVNETIAAYKTALAI